MLPIILEAAKKTRALNQKRVMSFMFAEDRPKRNARPPSRLGGKGNETDLDESLEDGEDEDFEVTDDEEDIEVTDEEEEEEDHARGTLPRCCQAPQESRVCVERIQGVR